MPGDCSPSRSVVSKTLTRSRSSRLLAVRCRSCRPHFSSSLALTFLLGFAATRPPRAIPPEGGGEGEAKGRRKRHLCTQGSTHRDKRKANTTNKTRPPPPPISNQPPLRDQDDLADVAPLGEHVVGGPASSKGKSRRRPARSCRRRAVRATARSTVRASRGPSTGEHVQADDGLRFGHLLDQEKRGMPRACAARWAVCVWRRRRPPRRRSR